jgi:hypothetical protein
MLSQTIFAGIKKKFFSVEDNKTAIQQFEDCLKISFLIGNYDAILNGAETRIPLNYDAFYEVFLFILFFSIIIIMTLFMYIY